MIDPVVVDNLVRRVRRDGLYNEAAKAEFNQVRLKERTISCFFAKFSRWGDELGDELRGRKNFPVKSIA